MAIWTNIHPRARVRKEGKKDRAIKRVRLNFPIKGRFAQIMASSDARAVCPVEGKAAGRSPGRGRGGGLRGTV